MRWASVLFLAGALAYSVNNGKLESVSSAGIAEQTVEFDSEATVSPKQLSLTSAHTLRLSATVPQPIPQQIALLFHSKDASHQLILHPRKNGKLRWEVDLLRGIPRDILAVANKSNGSLQLDLLVGGFSEHGKQITLANLEFEEKLWTVVKNKKTPYEWEADRFAARPPLSWTFKAPEKKVNPVLSLIGIASVLSPWILLMGFTASLNQKLLFTTPQPVLILFVATLAGLEGLLFSYWVGLVQLRAFMPLAAVGSLITLLAGREALCFKRAIRLKSAKA